MLDQAIFGAKLKSHRKNLKMSQEEVAEKIGVSAQAVSKWENGECLPDCFNLKLLGEVYGISLDILLETEVPKSIEQVSEKIEQLADEFVWTQSELERYSGDQASHKDIWQDLLKMWKGIFFIGVGDHELQKQDKERGSLRVICENGLNIWDDEGVVAVVGKELIGKLDKVGEREFNIMREICSADGIKLLSYLNTDGHCYSKEELEQNVGVEPAKLNELLLLFIESGIIEYATKGILLYPSDGYKLSGHFGISAYLAMAAMFILTKKCKFTVSEFVRND